MQNRWLHYEAAQVAAKTLEDSGYEAFIIGGAVRDMLLERTPKDFDLATNAKPDEVLKLSGFSQSHYKDTSQAYGVTRVYVDITDQDEKIHSIQLEIATYRQDIEAHLGRKKTKVAFSGLDEDVKRRDFTINALALNPDTSQVIDLVGGITDLEHKVLRFIGTPETRIQEDPLRILRAIRLKNQLGFSYERQTESALIQAVKSGLHHDIANDRIGFELSSMLMHENRIFSLRDLDGFGVMNDLLPEVTRLKGVQQPPDLHAEGDVWQHTMLAMQFLPSILSPRLAWATLLHDAGKAATAQGEEETGDRIRFNEHHAAGADIAKGILKRLGFGKRFREDVAWMIHHHIGIDNLPHMRPGRAKQFMSHPAFADLLELHKADAHAAWSKSADGVIDTSEADFSELEGIWRDFQAQSHHHPPSLKHDLGIDGAWLMQEFDIEPGPRIGEILTKLHEHHLDGEIDSQSTAREFAEQWLK